MGRRSPETVETEMIIVSTTRWTMPGRVFCSRSRRMAPMRKGGYKKMRSHIQHSGRYRSPIVCLFVYRDYLRDGNREICKNHKTGWRCEHIRLAVAKLPCVMVRRSSSKLRKESEATWGLPQRLVSGRELLLARVTRHRDDFFTRWRLTPGLSSNR
ncbi:hypothetical protein EYF80_029523 [Liparis tanakae]|uniref:Uncharacterized protein n=1 Tax=Liparis tanakae TaxID=230148 RepID=A0A4Z2H490_9TELE|nr:hypothetical protein EYF80_029523 [Liparis tanakae]